MTWSRWVGLVALVCLGVVIGCEVGRYVYPARPAPWLLLITWFLGAVAGVWIAEEAKDR